VEEVLAVGAVVVVEDGAVSVAAPNTPAPDPSILPPGVAGNVVGILEVEEEVDAALAAAWAQAATPISHLPPSDA
jgi:ferric-dicitrate binding protein FerR (iron transport regulator)